MAKLCKLSTAALLNQKVLHRGNLPTTDTYNFPQKFVKLQYLQERASVAEAEVKVMEVVIRCSTEESGIDVEQPFHDDLLNDRYSAVIPQRKF